MNKLLLIVTVASWLVINTSAVAQVGQGRVVGSPGARGGTFNRGVNPNFNPRGSLSTFGNLNPRGSLSPALNLNPPGSLLRPVGGGSTDGGFASGSRYTSYRPTMTPTPQQYQLMPRNNVHLWAAFGLQQLESSLAAYEKADVWREFLQLDKAGEIIESADGRPLNETSRTELQVALDRFQTIVEDPKFERIRRLPGFDATQTSLQELIRADTGDQRDRLQRSAEALNRALGELDGGPKWQKFLALPGEESLADLTRVQNRFRQVRDSPEYRMIADLPEFQATAENLEACVRALQD